MNLSSGKSQTFRLLSSSFTDSELYYSKACFSKNSFYLTEAAHEN